MVARFVCFFGFFATCLMATAYADHHENHRVPVTVYYESLCPDSRKFFIQQLYPSLHGNLSNYVNLTLIPFGKSSYESSNNGAYKFTCHHGPSECVGNKIHACAIKTIDDGKNSPNLGFNRNALGYINCLMDRSVKDQDFPTKECAELNQVTNLIAIQNCAVHVTGSQYLANYGVLTNALNPKLSSVPTIVFNREYKKDDSDLAQKNFVKALCQYIHEEEKPDECSKNSSSVIKTSIVIFIVMAFSALRSF